MADAAEEHETALAAAFVAVLRAEEAVRAANARLADETATMTRELTGAETALAEAWAGIKRLMAETGEVECLLTGTATDYRIHLTNPREAVKVDPAAIDAVPDEFVRVERKPRLKEIGDHLKALRATRQPMPNWARLERSEAKLTWAAVKKGAV